MSLYGKEHDVSYLHSCLILMVPGQWTPFDITLGFFLVKKMSFYWNPSTTSRSTMACFGRSRARCMLYIFESFPELLV